MADPLKGRLLVGQSGGPTPVINASLAGVIGEAKRHGCFTAITGMVHGIEGLLGEELVSLDETGEGELERLARTPGAALGSCRHRLTEAEYGRLLDVLRAHDVRHLVYIGGNDSMDTCQRISALAAGRGYELQVMGVPKTIDNDLAGTDHCPGYGSAARFVVLATRDAGRDLEAMATFDDVTILETMGRNTGWLAAAAGLAADGPDDAPHLLYVPELPFDQDRFIEDVVRVHNRLGRVFVVVSEGLRQADGSFVGRHAIGSESRDRFGHVLQSLTIGVAAYLTDRVRVCLGLQARFLRPGVIGRALTACVAETDRREALQVGREAVARLAAGESGSMVTLRRVSGEPYRCETGVVPLADVANAERVLPREFLDGAGTGISEAFRAYALPLIDGPLPALARLEGERVGKAAG